MLKFEGTDKIRDIKYEDGYVDKIYYDNNTLLVFTSDKEKTGTDEVLFKSRKLIDVTSYGKCIQTNLPLGYTQLEYIESSGTQYIDTGIKLSGNDIIETQFKCVENAGALYGVYGSAENSCFYANDTYYSYDANNNKVDTQVSVDTLSWHYVIHDFPSGLLTLDNTSISFTNNTFNNSVNSNLFARYYGSYSYFFTGMIKKHKITRNGNVILDLIPAIRISDSVIGMYDKVSNNFLTNAGTGTFIAGPDAVPTPDNPVNIVCNNGVVKYGVLGKNLFDGTVYNIAYISNPNKVAHNALYRGIIVPVTAGNQYTISRQTVIGNRFNWYFTPTYPQDGDTAYATGLTTATSLSATVTTPNGMSFLVVYFATDGSDILPSKIQVELGDTATPYESYRAGIYTDGTVETIKDSLNNTATTEMLLKVGDYQDAQSIIDGVVTRNVGVKVLDGTETISKTTSASAPLGYYFGVKTNTSHLVDSDGYCSNFTITRNSSQYLSNNTFAFGSNQRIWFATSKFTENSDFQQWLADQYEAGTPVIVVYPLATETTEQVLGQQLTIQQGNNTVEVTQASVDDILLKVKYK